MISSSTLRRALALSATLLLAAAADPGRGREQVVREAQARFPEDAWIVGYGEAPTGAEDAELRAVTNVAAAIRSEIRSNFRIVEVGASAGGRVSAERSATDDIERRVESEVAAFIRPRPELTRAVEGVWYAVAVARRADLDQHYLDQGRQLSTRLEALYRTVQGAPGWALAASPACQATSLETALDRKSEERFAVSRRSLWSPELTQLREQTVARRQRARAEVAVLVGRVPELEADPADAVVRGLRDAGWRSELVDDPRCRGPEDVLVRGAIASSCAHNDMLGVTMCRASVRYEGIACRGQSSIFTVASPDVAWTDGRPPAQARSAAGARVNAQRPAAAALARLQELLGDRCAPP